MASRRKFLGLTAIGAVAVGAPLVATAINSRAFAADGLPMTIVNSSGAFGNNEINVYIVGTELATGRQGYVRQSGVFTPCSPSDNGADGFADLAVKLNATGTTTINLPKMSGRVYFAIKDKLKFKVVTDGAGNSALQYPAGWVATDPSYNVLHDCVEFTHSDAGMFCNSTMVDMFSIPLAIKLFGAKEQVTGVLKPGGRDAIFAAARALPDFRRLVIGDDLRVIAPGHGIGAGLFSASYFDSAINEVWAKYATTDLKATTNAGTFTGRVTGGLFTFDKGVKAFAKPTTKDVLFCDGALAAPNDGITGPVAAILGAGFNRSTLISQPNQPSTDPSTFYRAPISNHYSRIIHEQTVDGKAYGFAFDDVVDFASYIQDTSPRAWEVTIEPFGAGNPNPGPSASAVATATATATASAVAPAPGGTRSAFAALQAETADAQAGTQIEGSSVAYVANGDWLRFDNVAFGTDPVRQFTVRAASGAPAGVSGLIEVRLGSRSAAPVGTIAVGNTGGWQSWRSVAGALGGTGVTGTHTVFLTFASGQPADFVNVDWLQFAR